MSLAPLSPWEGCILLILENPRSTLDFSSRRPGPRSYQLAAPQVRFLLYPPPLYSFPAHPQPFNALSQGQAIRFYLLGCLLGLPRPLQCLTTLRHAVFLCDFHHTSTNLFLSAFPTGFSRSFEASCILFIAVSTLCPLHGTLLHSGC